MSAAAINFGQLRHYENLKLLCSASDTETSPANVVDLYRTQGANHVVLQLEYHGNPYRFDATVPDEQYTHTTADQTIPVTYVKGELYRWTLDRPTSDDLHNARLGWMVSDIAWALVCIAAMLRLKHEVDYEVLLVRKGDAGDGGVTTRAPGVHVLGYQFSADGGIRRGRCILIGGVGARLRAGSPITVLYLPERPEVNKPLDALAFVAASGWPDDAA